MYSGRSLRTALAVDRAADDCCNMLDGKGGVGADKRRCRSARRSCVNRWTSSAAEDRSDGGSAHNENSARWVPRECSGSSARGERLHMVAQKKHSFFEQPIYGNTLPLGPLPV